MSTYFDDEDGSLRAYAEQHQDAAGTTELDPQAYLPGEDISPLVYSMLKALGEDPKREGLLKTPARVNAAMRYLTSGHQMSLDEIVNDALFSAANDDIVLVRNIEIFSLCEHHLLPFWGHVHVAYIPNGKVIGLSKLPRIADMFARRLQLQERLTVQITDAVEEVLKPRGVAVIAECRHMCMMMRGVEKNASVTVTRALRGDLRNVPELRAELAALLRGK